MTLKQRKLTLWFIGGGVFDENGSNTIDNLEDKIDSLQDDVNGIISATCNKIKTSPENYNLLKPSECIYVSRLQDTSTEIIASNDYNIVTNKFPVEYNKFYTISTEINGERTTYKKDSSDGTSYGTTGYTNRMIGYKKDGTIEYGVQKTFQYIDSDNGIKPSSSTFKITRDDIIAIQMQLSYIGYPAKLNAETLENYKVMITGGCDTPEESINKALTSEYISGDIVLEESYKYIMKHDEQKLDVSVYNEDIKNINETLNNIKNNSVSISQDLSYDNNYIINDRFIRNISNLRDKDKSKDFNITISNKSGKVIKNATIAVSLHNTFGINPIDNNLSFQIYDDVFSESVGFKFFDSDKELPYYIESESNCNYIVDKNIWTAQKTLAVFSNGKFARYNSDTKTMQLSTDDGKTWENICTNITSLPYRILLPDSKDNLFVASNDGYKLYKYTSSDNYQTGTEVIDMTSYNTQIGTILAEDSLGNLYLGTYQTSPWNCTIRKSTDHGDTWNIVFTTDKFQHVHNIYVNKRVTPNIIFIGLDGTPAGTYVSKDYGETWEVLDVPYGNRDYAFRYAGENFYIGCGERLYLGGATLYKTTDIDDKNAYYPLFDNMQGIRDVTNVIEGSDDVLIAGGCVGSGNYNEQLFLSEDRGETWKTVSIIPYYTIDAIAGFGLRTFSKRNTEIISQTATNYTLRFWYGEQAKTIVTLVNVGDIPVEGKTITLKTGYVTNVENMKEVLLGYEKIEDKVADINICDGYVVDKVSNKRVLTDKTERCDYNIKVGQTCENKILKTYAYRLNGSVNLGKLSRLNFTKGFTVSLLFRKEEGKTITDYQNDSKYHVIFQSGDTRLIMWYRSLVLMSGTTNIFTKKLYFSDPYFYCVNEDYIRVTATISADDLPKATIFTENYTSTMSGVQSTEYPITENLSDNDFIIGNNGVSGYADIPNITRIEIYSRVLTYKEILSLTGGCNLISNNSQYN